MAKHILIEELHLTITAAPGQPQRVYDALARTVGNRRFQKELRQIITGLFRRHPVLRAAKLQLTR